MEMVLRGIVRTAAGGWVSSCMMILPKWLNAESVREMAISLTERGPISAAPCNT